MLSNRFPYHHFSHIIWYSNWFLKSSSAKTYAKATWWVWGGGGLKRAGKGCTVCRAVCIICVYIKKYIYYTERRVTGRLTGRPPCTRTINRPIKSEFNFWTRNYIGEFLGDDGIQKTVINEDWSVGRREDADRQGVCWPIFTPWTIHTYNILYIYTYYMYKCVCVCI